MITSFGWLALSLTALSKSQATVTALTEFTHSKPELACYCVTAKKMEKKKLNISKHAALKNGITKEYRESNRMTVGLRGNGTSSGRLKQGP